MDPVLIDECLSPKPASVARERGLVAFHAVWVGMVGAEDWNLAALAAERDYIIVTNNRRDFLRLYAQLEVHNGLMIYRADRAHRRANPAVRGGARYR